MQPRPRLGAEPEVTEKKHRFKLWVLSQPRSSFKEAKKKIRKKKKAEKEKVKTNSPPSREGEKAGSSLGFFQACCLIRLRATSAK